jgi:O-antigen ligase
MSGVVWASSIWAVVLLVIYLREQRRPANERRLSIETVAVVIALLGTHSIVGATDADAILADPVAGERALRGLLAATALLLVGFRFIRALRANENHGYRGLFALAVYVGIAGLSTAFSAAPIVTAAKTFELGTGLIAVGTIALQFDGRDGLRRLVSLIVTLETALLAVAVIGFFALPTFFAQLQPRPGFISPLTMGAPYAHPNALSSMGALCGVYAVARILQTVGAARVRWWGVVVLGLFGTVLSSGRQGVVIWIVGAAVLLVLQRPRVFAFLVVPAAAWIVVSFGAEIWDALQRNRPTTFSTLTGRTMWWGAALDAWRDHPWTGWGYGVGGRFVALESIGRGTVSNIHSGYFEALVGVGIVGVIPLVYALFRAGIWSMRSLLQRVEIEVAILMVPLVLRTGVAQGFGGWLNFELILFACLVALADIAWIRKRADRYPMAPIPLDRDTTVRV